MYTLEKAAIKFFEYRVSWNSRDKLMEWAAQSKEWYKMGHADFKKAYESHVKEKYKIPKNANENTGMEMVKNAYFAYKLSKEELLSKELTLKYFRRSLKTV